MKYVLKQKGQDKFLTFAGRLDKSLEIAVTFSFEGAYKALKQLEITEPETAKILEVKPLDEFTDIKQLSYNEKFDLTVLIPGHEKEMVEKALIKLKLVYTRSSSAAAPALTEFKIRFNGLKQFLLFNEYLKY